MRRLDWLAVDPPTWEWPPLWRDPQEGIVMDMLGGIALVGMVTAIIGGKKMPRELAALSDAFRNNIKAAMAPP